MKLKNSNNNRFIVIIVFVMLTFAVTQRVAKSFEGQKKQRYSSFVID